MVTGTSLLATGYLDVISSKAVVSHFTFLHFTQKPLLPQEC